MFVNHFKSKLALGKTQEAKDLEKKRADDKRALQSSTVAKLVKARFAGSAFDKEYFAVLGDLNDSPSAKTLAALVKNLGMVDALTRVAPEYIFSVASCAHIYCANHLKHLKNT